MSFLYSILNNDTSAEKENSNAIRAKFTGVCREELKTECKQYESEYEQELRQAEITFKRRRLELKEKKDRQQMDAVLRVMNGLAQSKEYKGSSESTQTKLTRVRTWINYAATRAEENRNKERQLFDAKYGNFKASTEAPASEERKTSA
ncbi:hypothetical protein BGZ76_006625 [Entomortierella beljakovae]|nr:hypothetical protein BGZ76_006625 [Entomortierella beljakovae]